MHVLVDCPRCRRRARIPRPSAGKTLRCTGCRSTFIVRPGSGDLLIEWGPVGAGRRVVLSPGATVTIGRAAECTVSLPGPLVSRRHATLDWADSEWRLRDAGSANGTFVNGQRVREIGLTDGSRIVIGDFALRLNLATRGPSDLDVALDAMAVEESVAGTTAVVEVQKTAGVAADPLAETQAGRPALSAPAAPEALAPAPHVRTLLERWPVVLGLIVIVVLVVALLIGVLG